MIEQYTKDIWKVKYLPIDMLADFGRPRSSRVGNVEEEGEYI
jgi:hypothetical protein